MDPDSNTIVQDFRQVAAFAGVPLDENAIAVEVLPAPHRPPSNLPKGKMAVYVFSYRGQALKVGKVGPKSQARYVSQHYRAGSAQSTLAASLLKNGELIGVVGLAADQVSDWIKQSTDRVNYIVDADVGIAVLTLLEAFLQCRLNPVFEGFARQR